MIGFVSRQANSAMLIQQWFSQHEVAVISAFMMSLFTLGGVIGPLLTGAVQQATGSLQTGFVVVSCIHLGIFMVVFASEVELPPLPRLARRQAALAGAENA